MTLDEVFKLVILYISFVCIYLVNFQITKLFCFTESMGARSNKSKKKNRRRKDHVKNSSNEINGNHNKVRACVSMLGWEREGVRSIGGSVFLCFCTFFLSFGFDAFSLMMPFP